jgi:hypothetical protein
MRHDVVEGTGSNLVFGDENPEIALWLNSIVSKHVQNLILESLA